MGAVVSDRSAGAPGSQAPCAHAQAQGLNRNDRGGVVGLSGKARLAILGIRHVTRRILTAAICLLALSACEKGKPRHVPADPMALAPPPPVVAAPTEGLSAGLPKLKGLPGVSLDRVGAAPDPLNRKPAVTPGAEATVFAGFAFDPKAK